MTEQMTFWPEPSRERWWDTLGRRGSKLLNRLRASIWDRVVERREWTVSTPTTHRIVVEHVWNGAMSVLLDGQEIRDYRPRFFGNVTDRGFEHRFDLDGLPCIVRVLRHGVSSWYVYEFYLDGKLQ